MENDHQSTTALAEPPTAAETELAAQLDQRRREAGIVATDKPPPNPFDARKLLNIDPNVLAANEAKLARDEAEQAERQRASMVTALCDSAGERYVGCRLENFELLSPKAEHRAEKSAVLAALHEYARTVKDRRANREGLVLFGPVGTGKDHLAFAIARAAVLAGFTVRWLNGQDWFGQVRDAMDTDTSEASLVRRIAHPDFAVISDPLPPIGTLSQHQATMLYRAVNDRYLAGKPTVVTLNVASDDEADQRLGEATWDRLCHGTWKIRCNWPSYRKPAREVNP